MIQQLTMQVLPCIHCIALEVVEIGKKADAISYVDATGIQVMFTSFLTERCATTSRDW